MCRGKSTEEKKRVNSVEKNTGEKTKEKKAAGAVEMRREDGGMDSRRKNKGE